LRAFFDGTGHRIFGGLGHHVNERSWGAWLAHIDSDFWIGRCIGIDVPTLEMGVKSFGRFLQLE
jgi:hypothetical protein